MKTFPTITIFLAVPLLAIAEIPDQAKDILAKLSNWELDKQAELQREISDKRTEVVAVLERILEQRTRAGDLDGALSIRKEIDRLSPAAPSVTEPNEKEMKLTPFLDDNLNQEWLNTIQIVKANGRFY